MLLIHKIQVTFTHCLRVGVYIIYVNPCFVSIFSLVDTIPGGINAFIAYRRPIANQYVSFQQSTISYFYIAATNGDTSAVAASRNEISATPQDRSLLRTRLNNDFVSTSGINLILNRGGINIDTTINVGYTVVGEYTGKILYLL